MRRINISLVILIFSILAACGGKTKSSKAYYESENLFSGFIKDLNSKFSEKAAYKSIMFLYDKTMGNTILVKVARNTDSTALEEWFFMSGEWEKSEKVIENANQNKGEYLFTINGDFDLNTLVKMVDISKEKVESEKKLKATECKAVSLLMKNEGKFIHKIDALIIQVTIITSDGKSSYELGFDSKGKFEGFLN